jgi:SAM-dependent methyltransferase
MGLSPGAIKLYLDLWQRGFFREVSSVCDMGSQELHLDLPRFQGLVEGVGVPGYLPRAFAALGNWPGSPRCPARPFYELLGVTNYACVDLTGQYGAIRLDLNLPLVDRTLHDRFDLVTDHGTNEHAFNAAEAYRTMHRLCKPGGTMIIFQAVIRGNGYYTFDFPFFEGMAAANGYTVLHATYLVGTAGDEHHLPLAPDLLRVFDWSRLDRLGICYVFRKVEERDFITPYQYGHHAAVSGHFGYRLHHLADSTMPGRAYLPVGEAALHEVRAGALARHLAGRILRRLGFKSRS